VARRPIWEWESEECGGAKFELSFVSVESSRVESSQVVGWLNGRPGLLCIGTEKANIKLGVSGVLRNYSRSGSRVAVTDPQLGCSEKVT
jgi:hypothetical protein